MNIKEYLTVEVLDKLKQTEEEKTIIKADYEILISGQKKCVDLDYYEMALKIGAEKAIEMIVNRFFFYKTKWTLYFRKRECKKVFRNFLVNLYHKKYHLHELYVMKQKSSKGLSAKYVNLTKDPWWN